MLEMMPAKGKIMTPPRKGKTLPDPRGKTGPFDLLFREIQACKAKKTCPALKTRQFYFEPNSRTASFWKEHGFWSSTIDYRLMFVCESPGPSLKKVMQMILSPVFWFFT